MEQQKRNTHLPSEHVRNIEDILGRLKSLCQIEIPTFQDPKARALLETSADVLGGLEKAFHDFIAKNGAGWKEQTDSSLTKSSDPWD